MSLIAAITMIHLSLATAIGLSTEKAAQLCSHRRCQILSNDFSDIKPDHLNNLLGLSLNSFGSHNKFGYVCFHFGRPFSFVLRPLPKPTVKEKPFFFYPTGSAQGIIHYQDSKEFVI